MSMNLRDAALSYAARGWPVFPVHGIMDDGNGRPVCTCGRGEACGPDAGKHLSPIASRGRKDATRSTEKISRWWPDAPGATPWNIAILTGRRSGLYVVDGRSDAIARIPSDLPQTLASETGGGSTHLFFAYPDGVELFRNTTGRIAEGVKTRGDDGWLIVPPSLHHSGHAYSWQNDAEVAPLPPELLSRLGAPSVPSVRPSTVDASTLLDDVADLPIAAPSDRRSHRDPFAIVSTRIRGDDVEPALRALADRLARIGVERDAVVAAVCDANDRNADPQLDTDIAELLAYDAIAREVDRREILRKTTTASVVDAKTAGGQKKSLR